MTDFTDRFDKVSEKDKLKFLTAIIRHNSKLQEEFINFTKQESAIIEDVNPKQFINQVEEVQQQYLESFESIDLENPDWDNYHPEYDGYIEEWEQYQQASEQEFDVIFIDFKSAALDKLIEQSIADFTAMIIGLYEACKRIVIADEVCSFDDVNEYLIDEHKGIMKSLIEKVKLSAVSPTMADNAIRLFFEYCSVKHPDDLAYPHYFEPVIMCLADFTNKPESILKSMNKYGIQKSTIPQLVLLLNKKSGNSDEWLSNAILLYKNDMEVGKDLLKYYFEAKEHDKFVKIAHELFASNQRKWAEFLKDYVDAEIDMDLYFKVYYYLTVNNSDIEHYKKIRKYLTAKKFDKLMDYLRHNNVFRVEIYQVEEKYEEIKNIIEKDKDDWNFNKLIYPIINIFPEFCWNTIAKKLKDKINNERGRTAYQEIAHTLKIAKQIKGYESQTETLIMQLYNNKPNLPALRDEFRQAGLA